MYAPNLYSVQAFTPPSPRTPPQQVLDGPHEDLRRDALDTICALAVALGPDFAIFIPTLRKVAAKHRLQHDWFERLAGKLLSAGAQ